MLSEVCKTTHVLGRVLGIPGAYRCWGKTEETVFAYGSEIDESIRLKAGGRALRVNEEEE